MSGRYVLGRKLAVGGMAEIFQARVKGVGGFEKDVVVKRILPTFADDAGFRERFFQEARLAALLTHPHIVQVYELVEQDGDTLLAMEAVHGTDVATLLRALREDGKPLPIACALYIAACVADALAYAHDKKGADGAALGIVHRDVTPSNVLVSVDGVPKLIDFGIAKAASSMPQTQTGLVLGKAWYLSPEQCVGTPVDGKSDVFAIGIVLFQMIAGRVPFGGRNGVLAMEKIAVGNRARLSALVHDVPSVVEGVVDAALTVERAGRPTARELRAALERAIAAVDPDRRARDLLAELVKGALTRSAERKAAPAPVEGLPAASSPTLLLMDLSRVGDEMRAQADDTRDETGDTGPGPIDATLEVKPVSLERSKPSRGLVAAALVAVVGAVVAVAVVLQVRAHQAKDREAVAKVAPPVVPAAVELRARPAPPPPDDPAVAEPGVDAAGLDAAAVDDEAQDEVDERAPAARKQRARKRSATKSDAAGVAREQGKREEAPEEKREKVAGSGRVTFHAEPWAQVWLGGTSLGMTWTGATEVPAGRHTLLLKNPVSGHAKTVVVDVKAGSTQSMYVTLDAPRKPPGP